MALTTQSATIGGATKTMIVAADGSSNIAAAHVTVDASGAEKGVAANPFAVNVQPASVSTMTTASVTTSSAQVLAARTGRRRLSFQNTGAGSVTLLFGAGTATVGAGIVLASGGATNSQGGSWEEPAHDCWAGAVQAIGAAASTLTIIEG